ncbi:hypothetical protein [Mycobacterium sp. HM-7]
MTEHVCSNCGTPNAADARFCVECDEYLGWDVPSNRPDPDAPPTMPARPTNPDTSVDMPHVTAPSTTSPAQAPEVEIPNAEAVLEPEATIEVQVRNPSTIVDAYPLKLIGAPPWLTLSQTESNLMPGATEVITATFGMTPGTLIPAQTITVGLRACSQRDEARFTERPVTLTVPQSGPAVKMTTRPTAVRLVDETAGTVEVVLDNSSNHSRQVALSGADPEGKVRFTFSPPWLVLEPGLSSTALAEFTVPEIRAGETAVRQLTITATEGSTAIEAPVIVNQERTVAAALRLRIDPSSPHVRDSEFADVALIVDNRGSTMTRTVRFEGRDPEGAVRFSFGHPRLSVPADRAVTTSVRISTPPPPPGKESSKPFSVVATYGDGEVEATGSLVQSTSVTAYSVSRLTVTPETLRADDPRGELQFCIENRHQSQWLQAGMSGTDAEGVVQFEFSPPGFDVPPGGVAWGTITVTAPNPAKRGEEATRQLEVTASDNHETLTAKATFIHSGWDWIPIAQMALIVFGGLFVMWGAAEPWASEVRLFNARWLFESNWWSNSAKTGLLDGISQYGVMFLWHQSPDQFVVFSQPPERLSIFILAIALIVTAFVSRGKWTIRVAALIALVAVGFWLLLLVSLAWQHVSAGLPSYGMILILLGAALAAAGGLWSRVH